MTLNGFDEPTSPSTTPHILRSAWEFWTFLRLDPITREDNVYKGIESLRLDLPLPPHGHLLVAALVAVARDGCGAAAALLEAERQGLPFAVDVASATEAALTAVALAANVFTNGVGGRHLL